MQQAWMACSDLQSAPARLDELLPPDEGSVQVPPIVLPKPVLETMGIMSVTTHPGDGGRASEGCRTPYAVAPLQALAASPPPILCCEPRIRRSAFRGDEWLGRDAGEEEDTYCRFQVAHETNVALASDADELARALAPIRSPAQALGAIALFYPDLYVPIFHDEQVHHRARADHHGWLAFPGVAALEVETRPWGYLVRAPEFAVRECGRHHLLRQAFAVSRDGRVCRFAEPPQPLAYAREDRCEDAPAVATAW
jgi:hypothetical protein